MTGTVTAQTLVNTTTTLRVGYDGESGASADYFQGSIDEFALYKMTLTPSQVMAHYQAGKNTYGQANYLLGGLIQTNAAGAITFFDVDGPAGDLAYYTQAPSSSVQPGGTCTTTGTATPPPRRITPVLRRPRTRTTRSGCRSRR